MSTTDRQPPVDAETVALDLIVRTAEAFPGGAPGLRSALREVTGALQVSKVLAGLSTVGDARLAAAAIVDAAVVADDPVAALRVRAALLRVGCGDQRCAEADGLAEALDGAATVLDAL